MDDMKEKLVDDVHSKLMGLLHRAPYIRCEDVYRQYAVNWLMNNGVTVQEWISVNDRLPDTIPCSAGTAYSEAVNVLTDGRKVLTAIWDGTTFLCDADYWEAWGEKITHWTPVLLPLPQPPITTQAIPNQRDAHKN